MEQEKGAPPARTVGGHEVDPADGLDLERARLLDEVVEAQEDVVQQHQAHLGREEQQLVALRDCKSGAGGRVGKKAGKCEAPGRQLTKCMRNQL